VILDRNSAIPLYYQIRQHLLEQIQSGKLPPGQPLPSEHEISTHFGVSRMTARQAVKTLCDEGIAYSRSGLGTFVSGIKQEKTSTDLLSFTQEMKSRGCRPGSHVLSFREVTADTEVAHALHLKAGAKVFCLRRVRLADSVPMGVENSFLPPALYPGLLESFEPRKSLYRALAEQYGIRMVAANEVVEAALATTEQARLLDIKRGAAVFHLTRISYAQNARPVEFVRSIYRGDRWKIVSHLFASHQMADGRTVRGKSQAAITKAQTLPLRSESRSTGDVHPRSVLVNAKSKQEEL
jgi:GntR family transcriptional regulator